jgi:hypothetical protein
MAGRPDGAGALVAGVLMVQMKADISDTGNRL